MGVYQMVVNQKGETQTAQKSQLLDPHLAAAEPRPQP